MRPIILLLVAGAVAIASVPHGAASHDCQFSSVATSGGGDPANGLYLTEGCHPTHEEHELWVWAPYNEGGDCTEVFPIRVLDQEIGNGGPCVGVPALPGRVHVGAPAAPAAGVGLCYEGRCEVLEVRDGYDVYCAIASYYLPGGWVGCTGWY